MPRSTRPAANARVNANREGAGYARSLPRAREGPRDRGGLGMSSVFGALYSSGRALLNSRLGVVVTLVAAIIGAGSVGLAAAVTTGVIYACVNNSSGTVKIIGATDTCPSNWTLLSWGQAGGTQGPAGP